MRELRKVTNALLFSKLTPNVKDISKIAAAAIEYGADGLSGINTYDPEEYFEPHTGKTILYNPNGHIGGKSGEWIKHIAVKKISEMRKVVPLSYPILGMGGISIGKDVRNMRNAGANTEGTGRSRLGSSQSYESHEDQQNNALEENAQIWDRWGRRLIIHAWKEIERRASYICRPTLYDIHVDLATVYLSESSFLPFGSLQGCSFASP